MKTIFYLAGKPEPLAVLDLDIIEIDQVLTIDGDDVLRAALNLAGETDFAFAVSKCRVRKRRGEAQFQDVTIRRFRARSLPGLQLEKARTLLEGMANAQG